MALETFLPCTSLLRIRFDMKYATDTHLNFARLKYIKDLALKSVFVFLILSCTTSNDVIATKLEVISKEKDTNIVIGAERTDEYYALIKGKKIAVVGNQTSLIHTTHLVDSLISAKFNLVKVFSPEHGFRGTADAGAKVNSSIDKKTGLPIVSLYGNNKKPTQEQLKGIDVVIFDIQDVGVRFYTYISTLHYVMEACAEAKIPVILLDRPNPNGHYIDGPILEEKYKSFIGMHSVPIVYGMTIGEYGRMINGESWLEKGLKCDLTVIALKNYTHSTSYSLPVAPSPNLQTDNSIQLYPSLCFFEGTSVSVGRGTTTPFEVYGHPKFPDSLYSFIPKSMIGSTDPLFRGQKCYGYNLTQTVGKMTQLNLNYLMDAAKALGPTELFEHPKFFNLLAGNANLQEQIKTGKSELEIRDSWKVGLDKFSLLRDKYLLYP